MLESNDNIPDNIILLLYLEITIMTQFMTRKFSKKFLFIFRPRFDIFYKRKYLI
ncbi:hypothetical protein AAJ76_170001732 [Vairimorpha ceranae]|uniref:Uncharacterized protein n=1 Tax=Vairimorpha ceranae TaxID=40302 RepID=A0A0F9ZDC8_9MICR|nr:hypothetical protein AAJ76_170001732 [Vairimorpha ceranae]KKO75564.1 hypothetical protein AAJ76_170001732 [Vairimorpha ceranae]